MTRKTRERERKREREIERRDSRSDRDRRDRDLKRGRGFDDRDQSPVGTSSRARDSYRDRDDGERPDRRRDRGERRPRNPRDRRRSSNGRDERDNDRRRNNKTFRDHMDEDVVDDRRTFRKHSDNNKDMAYNDDQYESNDYESKDQDEDLFQGSRGSSFEKKEFQNFKGRDDFVEAENKKTQNDDLMADKGNTHKETNDVNSLDRIDPIGKNVSLTKRIKQSPSLSPQYSDDIAINEDTPPGEDADIIW